MKRILRTFPRFRRRSAHVIWLAAAALLVTPAPAMAVDDRPADPGVRCAAKIGPGEYEFYLPGAKVTDVNGVRWVCGPDGQWFRDYSAITVKQFSVTQVVPPSVLRP